VADQLQGLRLRRRRQPRLQLGAHAQGGASAA
jgi:hypothetical protein